MIRITVFLTVMIVAVQAVWARVQVAVHTPTKAEPCIEWGKARLEDALKTAKYELAAEGKHAVIIAIDARRVRESDRTRGPESFRIIADKDHISVIGFDAAGAMYGCLELAERIDRNGRLPEQLDECDGPGMNLRGTCILLMKLGSYDYPITPKEFP